MMSVLATADGPLRFSATVRGAPVYLDHDSLIELATGSADRRSRFVAALNAGGDLLFSVTNATELGGPRGASVGVLRDFLTEVGPNWIPVELNPFAVIQREVEGQQYPEACVSATFLRDIFNFVTRAQGRVILCDSSAFNLGAVVDWMQTQRAELEAAKRDLDDALIKRVAHDRARYEEDHGWLEEKFAAFRLFNPSKRCMFTTLNLLRGLVEDAKAFHLKKGDGVDFCHAAVGASFARFLTLDKQWKRRVDALPASDQRRTYYRAEVDRLVEDFEADVAARSAVH